MHSCQIQGHSRWGRHTPHRDCRGHNMQAGQWNYTQCLWGGTKLILKPFEPCQYQKDFKYKQKMKSVQSCCHLPTVSRSADIRSVPLSMVSHATCKSTKHCTLSLRHPITPVQFQMRELHC